MSVNLASVAFSTARASRPPTMALAAPIITMSRRPTVARARASRLRDDGTDAEIRTEPLCAARAVAWIAIARFVAMCR